LDWLGKKLTRSHCHAWSAAPAFFLPTHILGVKPIEPGFAKVLIEPNLCDLKWAKGTIPTPLGKIEVSYKISDDTFIADIKLPKGCAAEVKFPQNMRKFILNGKQIEGESITIGG
jgi:hypothetical protein